MAARPGQVNDGGPSALRPAGIGAAYSAGVAPVSSVFLPVRVQGYMNCPA